MADKPSATLEAGQEELAGGSIKPMPTTEDLIEQKLSGGAAEELKQFLPANFDQILGGQLDAIATMPLSLDVGPMMKPKPRKAYETFIKLEEARPTLLPHDEQWFLLDEFRDRVNLWNLKYCWGRGKDTREPDDDFLTHIGYQQVRVENNREFLNGRDDSGKIVKGAKNVFSDDGFIYRGNGDARMWWIPRQKLAEWRHRKIQAATEAAEMEFGELQAQLIDPLKKSFGSLASRATGNVFIGNR